MENMKPIPSIPGAFANIFGQIKLPDASALMPHGGTREYKTKWVFGSKRRSSKSARHEYFGILYRGKNYKIHRLVCEAFHGIAPTDKQVVLHMNENALDNRPDNLMWGTQKENLNFKGFVEYCKGRTGENSPTTKGRKNKQS